MIIFTYLSFRYLWISAANMQSFFAVCSRFGIPSLFLTHLFTSLNSRSIINRAVNSGAEMADILKKSQQLGTEKYPRKSEKWIQYGTSGFRTK